MFLTLRTISAAIAIAFLLPGIAASYFDSCNDPQLSGTTLEAYCTKENGGTADSSLNLNNCVANYNGVLTAATNGGYSGSCKECSLDSGVILACECRTDEGTYPNSNLNLGNFINNYNGVLAC